MLIPKILSLIDLFSPQDLMVVFPLILVKRQTSESTYKALVVNTRTLNPTVSCISIITKKFPSYMHHLVAEL